MSCDASYQRFPVELILPEKWYHRAQYRLMCSMHIAGIKVPADFVTDGASVPRPLWWLFPPVDRYFPAAVVHDYLLHNHVPWKEANARFRQALKECKIPRWRRQLMLVSVQLYGAVRTLWQRLTGS